VLLIVAVLFLPGGVTSIPALVRERRSVTKT
jgi:hypothetical protein